MASNDLSTHKNLTVFKQHGFVYKGQTGNQVYGYSIFSGKDNFWINPETKQWDCKNSGLHGGYQMFLKSVNTFCLAHMKGEKLSWLKKKRGFQRQTLKKHSVGFNPSTNNYVIPVWDAANENIWDLRIYNPQLKKIMGTSGCTVGLFGWDSIQHAKKIWLVEGEWDKMAMWEILYKCDLLETETVISVPGANTFKTEWHAMFKEKDVVCVYDKDDPKTMNGIVRLGAGPEGTLKIFRSLKNITKNLSFVHWPEDSKDGYDLNDFLIEVKNHKNAYNMLDGRCKSEPPVEEKFRKDIAIEDKSDEEIYIGEHVPCEDVYTAYKKWLYLPETTVIDVLYGAMICNRMPGDPLWIFIIAPSGATKTEFILSVSEAVKVMAVTTMTPHSLISGANFAGGGDPSLIPRLNKKNLLIKDFTTILNMPQTSRDEIFGILRDAYDGRTEKMFGNGVFRSYESTFGIIAGVTPAIELYISGNTAFGERFLGYRINIPDSHIERMKYLSAAMANVGSSESMHKDLSELGSRVLLYDYSKIHVEISDKIRMKLMILAQWTSVMRGTITRDPYSKEVIASPFIELGTRLVKQYTKLLMGICQFRNKRVATRSEYSIIRDCAISSIAHDLIKISKLLYFKGKNSHLEYKEVVQKTGLPSENCRRKIENLTMLKVVTKKKEGMSIFYKINDEIYDLINEGNIY